MMNRLGKGLVLAQLAISVLAMTWAAGIFLQFTDWGWKEPHTHLDQRIASEYDKRVAALKETIRARDIAVPLVKPAQDALLDAQARFPDNHLFIVQELAKLRSSPGPIEVKEIKYKDGYPVLDTPGKITGRPILEAKVDGIEKSYESYKADLKKIHGDIDVLVKESRKWTEAAQEISQKLLGTDESGKVIGPGLYALLDMEKVAQDQAHFEKTYLQPDWATALEQSEVLIIRRSGLERTLQGLQQEMKRKGLLGP